MKSLKKNLVLCIIMITIFSKMINVTYAMNIIDYIAISNPECFTSLSYKIKKITIKENMFKKELEDEEEINEFVNILKSAEYIPIKLKRELEIINEKIEEEKQTNLDLTYDMIDIIFEFEYISKYNKRLEKNIYSKNYTIWTDFIFTGDKIYKYELPSNGCYSIGMVDDNMRKISKFIPDEYADIKYAIETGLELPKEEIKNEEEVTVNNDIYEKKAENIQNENKKVNISTQKNKKDNNEVLSTNVKDVEKDNKIDNKDNQNKNDEKEINDIDDNISNKEVEENNDEKSNNNAITNRSNSIKYLRILLLIVALLIVVLIFLMKKYIFRNKR